MFDFIKQQQHSFLKKILEKAMAETGRSHFRKFLGSVPYVPQFRPKRHRYLNEDKNAVS